MTARAVPELTPAGVLESWKTATLADLAELQPLGGFGLDYYETGRPVAWELQSNASTYLGRLRTLTVLDVGAGVGRVTGHLSGWAKIGAVEPNPLYRAKIEDRAALAGVTVFDTLDAVGALWDVVFAFDVLGYYPAGGRLRLLQQLADRTRRLLVFQLPTSAGAPHALRYRTQWPDHSRSGGYDEVGLSVPAES